jgi:hypothetical protein
VTSVGVIVPWHPCEDHWRERALMHVLGWWEKNHPDWPVALGQLPNPTDPWRKGLAVHRGLAELDTDIVVVCDADVICDGVTEAVEQIVGLRVGWAVPHRMVYRMNTSSTTLLYQDERYPPLVGAGSVSPDYCEVYPGTAAGGLVVLPSRMLRDIPIDPRFVGWGQEDQAWARALTMVAGHPWRGRAPLYHLWHEPQKRMTRGIGSPESLALWTRYEQVPVLPAMLDLVEEARLILADNPPAEDQLDQAVEIPDGDLV